MHSTHWAHRMQKSIGCSPSRSHGWLGAVCLCSHPTSQQNLMPNTSTWQKTTIQSTVLPNTRFYTMWSQRSVRQPIMKAGPPGLVRSAAELQSTCVKTCVHPQPHTHQEGRVTAHWTLQSCAGRESQDSGTKNSQLTMLFISESPKADWTSSLVLPALHLRLFSSPLLLQSRQ